MCLGVHQQDSQIPAAGISFPGDLPQVTSVGGTTLELTTAGQYLGETAWTEPLLSQGSTGGQSSLLPAPSWQQAPGVDSSYSDGTTCGQPPGSYCREVPDVSADAAPQTGAAIRFAGRWLSSGGTSLATPVWAAITALVDEYLQSNGDHPVGFANPLLYRLARSSPPYPPYHDVTAGTNDLYPAGPGYDMVTGLGTPDAWNLARDLARIHAHSAFPDEGVLRLAVVSSLFPQLAGASRSAYRVAFGLIVLLLVGLAVAGLTAPVIAVSALAIPLLFLIYLYEVAPRDARFAVPTAVIFLTGVALGAAWALLLGPVVADSLVPGLATSLTNGGVLASAVAVPAIGQLLMLLPVAVAWLRRPDRSEALDGFTAGVASALGLTMAATLTELAPLLRAGNLVQGSSVVADLTEAVIRGISVPLVAVAATGYIGAALWSRRGIGSAAGGRWFTHPVLALMIALVVEIGLGYADDAVLPDIVLLAVHLAAAALALLALRIGLHHVLLHEQRDVRIGPPRVCPHCHRVVPAMPFCPICGVAERATRINPHAPPASGEWAQDTATENAAAFPDASPGSWPASAISVTGASWPP